MKTILLYLVIIPYISFGQFTLTDLLNSFENSNYEDVLFSNTCELNNHVNETAKISHFINDYHHLSDWE